MAIDKIRAIKACLSLRDYIPMKYGIRLEYNRMQCPFGHGETRKNLHIYHDGYYCHACHAKGDIVNFVAEVERLSQRDVVNKLWQEIQGKDIKKQELEYQKKQKRLSYLQENERRIANSLIRRCRLLRRVQKELEKYKLQLLINNIQDIDKVNPALLFLLLRLQCDVHNLEQKHEKAVLEGWSKKS